ncbi:MAG: septal ring lytic transglycosylase RlpA family protein, partial [Proteobacteria bacterium]
TTGQTVQVRINDRGPYGRGRVIDLSFAAAKRLGMISKGMDEVEVRVVSIP